jgi:hypothetical protein
MPVWIADTDANRRTAESVWIDRLHVEFTEPGGLTTFRINPNGTPEDWFEGVLGDVAGHHDRYSHMPGYSTIEAFGVSATPRLRALLALYRLTLVSPRPDGFTAATSDGSAGFSPNDDMPSSP